MMNRGFFGELFDFNHDGNLDPIERTMDYIAFENMIKKVEDVKCNDVADEIDMSGLDYDELSYMDEDERRDALEDAGLDPDDFDF